MKKIFYNIKNHAPLIATSLLCCASAVSMQAQTCEGRVCLKDGSRQLYVDKDRIEIPRKSRDVETYRNFFSHQCKNNVISIDNIDSVVVWNTASPQNTRILVPLKDVGWSWLYIDHPRMQVYIYASQGYSVNALGGMKAWQGNTVAALFLIPSKTSCDFYIMQADGTPFCLGDAYKKCDKAFIRKLCHCVGISQEKEQELINSGESNRSTMLQMVADILDKGQSQPTKRKHHESYEDLAAIISSNGGGDSRPRTQER